MEKSNSMNGTEILIRNKKFNPEKYGMAVCPVCKSKGYVQNPKRQCCPKCGGFGFTIKGEESCRNEGEGD
jgi:uncharacterized OB-fold protein